MKRSRLAAGLAAVLGAVPVLTVVAASSANEGTTSVTSSADAYAKEDRPANDFGTQPQGELLADSRVQRQTYVKFPVTVPSGQEVTSASVTLNFTKVPGPQTVSVYATDSWWTERTLTWSNKPAAGALQESKTIKATGKYTFTVNVAAGDNSFVVTTDYTGTNTQFNTREATTATNRPTLTVTTAPVDDPRSDLFDRAGPLKGTQIGAWDMDGGLLTSNATARDLVRNGDSTASPTIPSPGVDMVRWQMWRPPCDLRSTNCQTTTQFQTGLDTMRQLAAANDAVLLISLPPIWGEQCPGGPDEFSYAWQQWVVEKVDDFLDGGGSQDVLFEMGNEPDNPAYCDFTGQEYFNRLWVNVPKLKEYARTTLHREIYIGGPGWMNSYTSELTPLQTWLDATASAYSADGNNRDWIPDFVSTHTYLTETENASTTAAQSAIDGWESFYISLRGIIDSSFAGLTDEGFSVPDQIKIIDSEYNFTIHDSSTLSSSQTWTDFYYDAMFQMFADADIWAGVQFTAASRGGDAPDLLTSTGAAKPAFKSFAAQ
jgi:hypothetical protein